MARSTWIRRAMLRFGREKPFRANHVWCSRCEIVPVHKYKANPCVNLPLGEVCSSPSLRITNITAVVMAAAMSTGVVFIGWDLFSGNTGRLQWLNFMADKKMEPVTMALHKYFVKGIEINRDHINDIISEPDEQSLIHRKSLLMLKMSEIREPELKSGLTPGMRLDKAVQWIESAWNGCGETFYWNPVASMLGWDMFEPDEEADGTVEYRLRVDGGATGRGQKLEDAPIVAVRGWAQTQNGEAWAVYGIVNTSTGRAAWTEDRDSERREVRACFGHDSDGAVIINRINEDGSLSKAVLKRSE